MTTTAIVQARMDSTRLPGKTMMEITGRPLLWHVLDRVTRMKGVDQFILSCPMSDVGIFKSVAREFPGVEIIGGPHPDLLTAFHDIAWITKAETIIRFTADCWSICPRVSESVLDLYRSDASRNYAANLNPPMTWPEGLDTEVFSARSLDEAHRLAVSDHDRHHVTPWIRANKRVLYVNCPDDFYGVKLSVDTQDDLDRARRMRCGLPKDYGYFDLRAAIKLERARHEQ